MINEEVWSTEVPPSNLNKDVLVCCGNGETRVANSNELTQEHKHWTWVAWREL